MKHVTRLYEFSLPLKKPLVLQGVTHMERRGLIVELQDDAGWTGTGEASPLEGFSTDSFLDVRRQLHGLLRDQTPLDIPDFTAPLQEWQGSLGVEDLLPSVRFALESASLHIATQQNRDRLHDFLGVEHDSVFVNGLVTADLDIADEVERLIGEGFKSIKLKLGHLSPQDAAKRTRRASDNSGGRVRLRVDINRAWSIDEADEYGRLTKDVRLEFVEEPTSTGVKGFTEVFSCSDVAIDESLVRLQPHELSSLEGIDVVVLKPTILGGLARSAQFARYAMASGKEVVVTSSFESSVGLSALVVFAACCGSGKLAHGLETGTVFGRDTTTTSIRPINGALSLGSTSVIPSIIDYTMLSEIT